jgi:replicative DNA helicase
LLGAEAQPINYLAVATFLEGKKKLAEAGGKVYISELEASAIGKSMMGQHVKMVKEAAIKREIEQRAQDIPGRLVAEELPEVIAQQREFYQNLMVAPAIEGHEYFDKDEFIEKAERYGVGGKATGLATLDRYVQMLPGELVVIGARVRHGKSSCAYNFFLNFVEHNEEEMQVFVNCDVPSDIMHARLLTIRAKRASGKPFAYKDVLAMCRRRLFPAEIKDALDWMHGQGRAKRLASFSVPHWSVEDIVAQAERVAHTRKLGAIFVDYAELVKSKHRSDSEELRIAHTVNSLRIAAERLGCLVILISQMNRASVKDHPKREGRPTLEGLRYCGRIEAEASTVLGVYNPDAERETEESHDLGAADGGHTELQIITLKNRGGRSNRTLSFDFDQVSGNIAEEVV